MKPRDYVKVGAYPFFSTSKSAELASSIYSPLAASGREEALAEYVLVV